MNTIHPRANALPIGDTYSAITLRYCADDNAHWPVPIERTAWACPMRSSLPRPAIGDLFTEMFGEA